MSRPNLFILGAPKSGTTALHHYLSGHARIAMSEPKEPHFFCEDFENFRWAHSEPEYIHYFDHAPSDSLAIGDASPLYLYSSVAAKKIAAFAPDGRVVVMLRPYEGYLRSLHNHLVFNRDEIEPDFDRAWRLREERSAGRQIPSTCREPRFLDYSEIGRVGKQLARVYDAFERERVLVLLFEDFVKDTAAAYAQTLEFLGVPHDGKKDFPKINEAKAHRYPILANLTQRPPELLLKAGQAVKRRIGLEDWSALAALRDLNTTKAQKSAVSAELRAEISAEFREDARLLSELLGRDVSHWCP